MSPPAPEGSSNTVVSAAPAAGAATAPKAPLEHPTPAPISPPPEAGDVVYHTGPKGTALHGFAVGYLNKFHYDTARAVDLPPKDEEAIKNTLRTHQGVDVRPYTIVEGPQDWKADDFRGEANAHKWLYRLSETDIAEIDAALASIQEKGIKIEDLKKEDFPLPTLGPQLEEIERQVVLGKGFHLIRNFPTHRYTRWQTVAAYYAFGLYWGNPQAQNAKGHIVGHIRAIGTDPKQTGVRPYTTTTAHGYHTDGSDVAGLLCLREAKEGGVTSWASSIAVHNELLRRGRKDLVEVLASGGFWLPTRNVWGSPDDQWDPTPGHGWVDFPIFLYANNRLTVNYKEGAYYYRYRFPDAPRFTPLQEEALRTFTALAMSDELRLDLKLEPGDIGLVNNLSLLHAKSAFVDHDDPAKKRHLLRLWVAAKDAPPLPADSPYLATWGSVEIGSRGGYWLGHNYVGKAPLESEFGDLEANRPKVPVPDVVDHQQTAAA